MVLIIVLLSPTAKPTKALANCIEYNVEVTPELRVVHVLPPSVDFNIVPLKPQIKLTDSFRKRDLLT